MSGFQVFNTAGALVVDSSYKGTYNVGNRNYTPIYDKGAFSFPTPWGSMDDMGFSSQNYEDLNNLRWFKFNNGAKVMFGGGIDLCTDNAGNMAYTNSTTTVESGYLNVYDASGVLVWSAQMAARIPRIIGFFDIPANFDLDNANYSQNIGTNTWLLASNSPGNITTDGAASGYSGLFYYFSGGFLSCRWLSKNQLTWAQTMKGTGLRIPYAILPNLT